MTATVRKMIDSRYAVLGRLGEGGMGTVYRVADTLRDSAVLALKLIPRARLAGASLRYFRNEFRALARLHHPNLTEVFDFGRTRDGSHFYYTSEFVDGPDLLGATEECRTARHGDEAIAAFRRLYDLIGQTARALDHIHDRGYVHFDVKPANLLVARPGAGGPGTVKLVDFGLSSERAAAVRPGLRGTMAYMPPEVISGDPVDRRADLYSLGAALYEAATGHRPFEAPSDAEIERMHLEAEPAPPRVRNALIPPPLEKAILRLLRKDPAGRYATASDLVRAIRVFSGRPIEIDSSARPATRLLRPSFVGRQQERRALADDLRLIEAASGPRVTVLRGEAGIGKSRLARDLKHRAQLRGIPVVSIEARGALSARTIARRLLDAIGSLSELPERAREQGAAIRRDLDGAGRAAPGGGDLADPAAPTAAALGERLAAVIARAASDRPLALFLDAIDEAEADGAVLLGHVLAALALRERPARLLLVAAARDGALAGPIGPVLDRLGARVLDMGPLASLEVVRFLESALGFPPGGGTPRLRDLARLVLSEVGGNPLRIERMLDALARAGAVSYCEGRPAIDREALRRALGERPGGGKTGWAAEVFARSFEGLDPDSLRVAECLALFEGPVALELLRETASLPYGRFMAALDALRRRDLVEVRRPEGRRPFVAFRHGALRRAARDRLDEAAARAVNDAAVGALERRIGGGAEALVRARRRLLERIARHALGGSDREKALRYALAAADRSRDLNANERALDLYSGALDLVPAEDAATRSRILEELGRLDEVAGRTAAARERYLAALAAASALAGGEATARTSGRLLLRLGAALTTLCDLAGARRNFHAALRMLPRDAASLRAELLGRLAWCAHLPPRNRTAAALRLARRGLRELASQPGPVPDGERAVLHLESALGAFHDARGELEAAATRHRRALGLARRLRRADHTVAALGNLGRIARRRGDFETAGRLLDLAARRARRAGLADVEAQVLSNLGMHEWARGRFARAGQRFAAARAIFAATGNVDMGSLATSNVAYALEKRGEYAEALAMHGQALERARAAGRRNAELRAEIGVASTAVLAGDLEAAARALDRAAALLPEAGTRALEAEVIEARVRLIRAEGRLNDALALADRARDMRHDLAPSLDARVAAFERADLLAELRDPSTARLAWREAVAAAREERSRHLRALAAFVRGRIALAEARHGLAARAFLRAIAVSPEREDVDLAWRTCRLLGHALAATGDGALAEGFLDRAARIVRAIDDKLPPDLEARFRRREGVRDLLARRLGPRGAAGGGPAPGGGAAVAGGPDLRLADLTETLVEVNRALARERDRDKLLEMIMDTAIRLAGAERGFIMLASRKPTARMRFEIGRSMAREDIRGKHAVSATVVRRVIEKGEPVVLADARRDPAFRSSASIVDLKLASVLCMPLKAEGKTAGVIYLDHRFRTGAFGEAQVRAVAALADQAVIALENARLLRETERSRAEVEALAQRLQEQVARQDRQLVAMQRALDATGADPEQPRRYEGLVGASPVMIELFRVLDRVTDSMLPVLIQGESGTGKDLVARAIHMNGGRRLRPFVVENCSAIAESLLEAELFGAKKGAYTGSYADRPGLFEVASGGTLFLDEVGDMSLAMQAKLLRALERGEIRPVGSSRMIRIDVRIIAATNQDLRARIAAGRFREDLFYRLNVLAVTTPPLRERTEDIPVLVDHFLERIAAARREPKKELGPGVLDVLVSHDWPGNVRELMHEVERAAQLSDATIGVEALSPQIRSATADAFSLHVLDGRTLKLATRATERRVILAALAKVNNNRSRAARLLGISRWGLLQRMQRCDLA